MRHENVHSSRLPISKRSMIIGLGTTLATATPLGLRSASAEEVGCGVPIDIGDGWRTAKPASVGIDASRLCALTDWLDNFGATNVHSVLVIRNGALAFEHYRKGNDEIWDKSAPNAEHGPTTKHDMRSVSKSVTSLLVGVALDRKLIPSVDEPIFNYFPEYADLRTPKKARITLRHLLMMASGLQWDENLPYTDPNNGEVAMLGSTDRWRFALQPRLLDEPGSVWNYSGGCTELLGAIVRKAAGKPIERFADDALFAPLGISDWSWVQYPDKIPNAASGLQLRSRDLAKIGKLVLNRGRWGDKPIVSEQWISESTSAQIGPEDRTYFYGYQWWLARSLINRREVDWVAGMGLGGQRLFIVPSMDLVCIVTAGHYTDSMQNWLPLLIFNRFVMPAVE
jgi:CubicO group peptidase (beta-lactamase class C family)